MRDTADADSDDLLDVSCGGINQIRAERIRPRQTICPLKEVQVARGASEQRREPLLVVNSVREVQRVAHRLHETLTCSCTLSEVQSREISWVAAPFKGGR